MTDLKAIADEAYLMALHMHDEAAGLSRLDRVNEIQHRVLFLLGDARRGGRPDTGLMLRTVAHLLLMELAEEQAADRVAA